MHWSWWQVRSRRRPPPLLASVDELQRVSRCHRWLLYGGATLLTLLMALTLATVLRASADDTLEEHIAAFDDEMAALERRLANFAARRQQAVARYESIWELGRVGRTRAAAFQRKLRDGHGAAITGTELTVVPQQVMTRLTSPADLPRLIPLLALLGDLSPGSLVQLRLTGRPLQGIIYDPARSFMAAYPPIDLAARMQAAGLTRVTQLLDAQARMLEAGLVDATPRDGTAASAWSMPHDDLLSGRRVVSYVSRLSRRGQVFAVLSSDLALEDIGGTLLPRPWRNGFALLAANGEQLAGAPLDQAARQRIADTVRDNAASESATLTPRAHPGGPGGILFRASGDRAHGLPESSRRKPVPGPRLERNAGQYLVTQLLPGTDWILAYRFDQRAITTAMQRDGTLAAVLTFSLCAALWLAVWLLQRFILDPLVSGARQAVGNELAARRAAEAADHAKSRLLTSLSHEIRTPLHGALGNLELLARVPIPRAHRNLVSTVQASFESLLRVVNDILDFSRDAASDLRLEHVPFNPADPVDTALNAFIPTLQNKGIRPIRAIDADVPTNLVGAPARLGQILTNLIGNAAKFTQRGSVSVTVQRLDSCPPPALTSSLRFSPESSLKSPPGPHVARPAGATVWLRIAVSDTGIGIAKEAQARLFAPFTQADDSISKRYGGTGLGLALCKMLAEKMAGRIALSSLPGKGTTVSVDLPFELATGPSEPCPDETLMNDAAASAQRHHPQWPSTPAARSAVGLAILVVEDDPVSRSMLVQQLAVLGHTDVVLASDGRAALQACLAAGPDHYDLILSDLRMPSMDGREFVSALRTHGIGTVVVIVSASPPAGGLDDGLGPVHLLAKPVSLAQLAATLGAACPPRADAPAAPGASAPGAPTAKPAPARPATSAIDGTMDHAAPGGLVPGRSRMGPRDALRAVFLTTYQDDLATVCRALENNDADGYARSLHKLKGALAILGEKALAQDCAALASQARRASALRTTVGFDRFRTALRSRARQFAAEDRDG